jgi:integrase
MSINSYIEDGKRLYEVRVKVRNSLGRQVTARKKGISSERKAKDVEFDLKKKLSSKVTGITSWTWKGWHRETLRRMRLELKQATVMKYDGMLKKWLPQEWMDKSLHSFTKNDIYDFTFVDLPEKGVSASSQRDILKMVKRIFEMAVEDGILSRNPAHGIKVKLHEPEQLVLTAKEANILLESAKAANHPFYPVWAFALMTGMRSGEMYALRWSDIDLEAGVISITKQWTSKDGIKPPKSRRNRVVDISSELRSFLLELKAQGGHKEKLWYWDERDRNKKVSVTVDDLVLPRINDWKFGTQAQVLEDFCRGIGISQIKFHDLRATYITNLLTQGVSLVTVMAIVGHSKMSTTDRYVRLTGVSIKGASDKLAFKIPKDKGGEVISIFGNKS